MKRISLPDVQIGKAPSEDCIQGTLAQVSATRAVVSSKVPPDWSHYQTQILHIFSQSTNILLSTYYVLATAPGAVDAPKNKATLFMLLRLTLVTSTLPCVGKCCGTKA